MGTLTIPHQFGDAAKPLRRRVVQAWRRVQSGRAWLELKSRLRLDWTVRALEVTTGPNGWHPHLHVLFGSNRPLKPEEEQEVLAFLRKRWADEVVRLGWRVPSETHGVTFTRAHREEYVAKLARELVRGSAKKGRSAPDFSAHRTPMELLEDVARFNRSADVRLWREYCDAFRGAAQLTWGGTLRSKAAREKLGIDEQTDLGLAGVEERAPTAVVATIAPDVWDTWLADNPALQVRVLRAAEELGAEEAITSLLDRARGLSPPPF